MTFIIIKYNNIDFLTNICIYMTLPEAETLTWSHDN